MSDRDVSALTAALAEPFAASEVKSKPVTVSGNRALALFYVDARVIQDRLDDVLGMENWQDDYEFLSGGEVVCRLRVRLGDEWIQKVDVGGQSEQQDGGDRLKAAFSDALKRAAVKFGVGRYLYRVPSQWVDYDPQKRQFVRPPQIPASALPKGKRPDPTPSRPSGPTSASTSTPPPPAGEAPEPPDEQTIQQIEQLIINRGLKREAFDARLVEVYGTASLRGLTQAEAKEVEASLNKPTAKKTKASAGAA